MSTTTNAILLVGRVLFVALFLVSARGHIVSHERYVTIAKGRIPYPYLAGWPVGIWLILASVSMVLGIWPDLGSLMMALFLVPTTVFFHAFWTFSDPAQRRTQQSNFFRNVSLLGATLALLALFSVAGPGRFAISGTFFNLR